MKAKLNNPKIILWLLATSLFLSVSQSAFGQEIIREVTEDYLLCDTSIIRAIDNDAVLIYNKRSKSTFMLVASGMDTIPTMYFENYFVNDFEIVGKAVYFCGYRLDGGMKKAIFGYFNLSSIPNGPVSYFELDTCTELKKLDCYQIEDMTYYENHIVMTGTTGTRSNVLVDKIMGGTIPYPPFPPYPLSLCEVYFSNNENESFDDVMVTDNYVVVSTRNKAAGLPVVDFWQFDKPTLSMMYIFNSNIHHIRLGSPYADTPVFLEHESGDRYAAVYKDGGFPRIVMLKLGAPNIFNNCVEILDDEMETIIPMDIKYNGDSAVYDILARIKYYRNDPNYYWVPMQIYHITPTIVNNQTIFGNGTRYANRRVWSIDPMFSTPYFSASGDESQIPRMFRYRHDQWIQCPERFLYKFVIGQPEIVINDDYINEVKVYDVELNRIDTWVHKIPFPIRCPNK